MFHLFISLKLNDVGEVTGLVKVGRVNEIPRTSFWGQLSRSQVSLLFHSTIPVSDVPKRGVKLMERQSRSSSIFLYHYVDSSESGVCVRGAQMRFNVGLHLRNLKDFRGQCSSSASWIEFAQRGTIWKIQIIKNFNVILTCVCQV